MLICAIPNNKHYYFINNKHDSVQIYSICWSKLYLFPNSTIFSTTLTTAVKLDIFLWLTFKFDHGVHTSGQGPLGKDQGQEIHP